MASKILRRCRNLRLKVKFFLILFLTLLLMLVATNITFFMIEQECCSLISSNIYQLLTLFSERIDNELDKIDDLSYAILADNALQDALSRMKQAQNDTRKWLDARADVRSRFYNISLTNKHGVLAMGLKTKDGTLISGDDTSAIKYDHLFFAHEEAIHAAEGSSLWVADVGSQGAIYLMRDIREIKNMTFDPIGTMAIKVDLSAILNKCDTALLIFESPLYYSVALNGQQVYTNSEVCVDGVDFSKGYAIHKNGEERMYSVRFESDDLTWTYTASISYDKIMSAVHRTSRLASCIIFLVLALALVLGLSLISSILKHFKKLTDKFDVFAQGRWTSDSVSNVYHDRTDEIGVLHNQFDKMAVSHNQLVEDMLEKQQLLSDAQLRQLRAQIHPHFIYNTLGAIYWLSVQNDDQRVAQMAKSLSQLIKVSVQDCRDMVTIGEDLSVAEEYMNIQTIRFGSRLHAELQIEEDERQIVIPSMTIQPLVENAVNHGAEKMLDDCWVRVFCQPAGEYLDIVVEDNGPGMAEDTLEMIERGEIIPEGLGVGLTNIHKRIRLTYHDDNCGLRIRRVEGRTQVIVRIQPRKGEGSC